MSRKYFKIPNGLKITKQHLYKLGGTEASYDFKWTLRNANKPDADFKYVTFREPNPEHSCGCSADDNCCRYEWHGEYDLQVNRPNYAYQEEIFLHSNNPFYKMRNLP
jgi:hypothetical protein